MHQRGIGCQQDSRLAVKFYQKAATLGVITAELSLALIYLNGVEGVPADARKGVRWMRKAADHGLPEAKYDLGVLYSNGNGVDKSETEAKRWFSMAAAQGYVVPPDGANFPTMQDTTVGY